MSKFFDTPLTSSIAPGAAIAFTALLSGLAVLLSGVPEVKAGAPLEVAVQQHAAKADRLPVRVKGTACSSRGWPHYERICQFDVRRPADEMRAVRIVALR
jgi:hypothetical protein